MEHNLELIKSRMARYEALAEADNSDGTSFDSDSDSNNSNDVSNSDILDSSDSGSNESFHSTRRPESGTQKAVEAESKPRLSAYSKRRSNLPKLASAHSLHKNLTSEEEKENADQSPFAK